jgi:hypothetical protein
MKLQPGQVKEFGVFTIFIGGQSGTETFVWENKSFKRSRTFEQAEAKILKRLHKPKGPNAIIGISRSELTILPIYRLK